MKHIKMTNFSILLWSIVVEANFWKELLIMGV